MLTLDGHDDHDTGRLDVHSGSRSVQILGPRSPHSVRTQTADPPHARFAVPFVCQF